MLPATSISVFSTIPDPVGYEVGLIILRLGLALVGQMSD